MARIKLRSQTEGETGEVNSGAKKKTKAEYQAEFEAKLNAMPDEEIGEPSDERYQSGFEEAQEGVREAERFGLVKHMSRSRLAALKKNLLRQYQAGRYGQDTPENFNAKVEEANMGGASFLAEKTPENTAKKKSISFKPTDIKPINPKIDALKRQMALQGKK